MRLLLDTHTLLWWLSGSDALSIPARAAIIDANNEVLVSNEQPFDRYGLSRLW